MRAVNVQLRTVRASSFRVCCSQLSLHSVRSRHSLGFEHEACLTVNAPAVVAAFQNATADIQLVCVRCRYPNHVVPRWASALQIPHSIQAALLWSFSPLSAFLLELYLDIKLRFPAIQVQAERLFSTYWLIRHATIETG